MLKLTALSIYHLVKTSLQTQAHEAARFIEVKPLSSFSAPAYDILWHFNFAAVIIGRGLKNQRTAVKTESVISLLALRVRQSSSQY